MGNERVSDGSDLFSSALEVCQYVHYFIDLLFHLVVPQTVLTELNLYLKFYLYLTLRSQKFSNYVLYSGPVRL